MCGSLTHPDDDTRAQNKRTHARRRRARTHTWMTRGWGEYRSELMDMRLSLYDRPPSALPRS